MAKETIGLRIILGVLGFAFIALGVNVAVGGILTLGLQIDLAFVAIADAVDFAKQDNHVRFLGGLMTAIGACFVIATVRFDQFRNLIFGLCIIIISVAGLFRLTQSGLPSLLDAERFRSFLFEVAIFPAIAFWIARRHPQSLSMFTKYSRRRLRPAK